MLITFCTVFVYYSSVSEKESLEYPALQCVNIEVIKEKRVFVVCVCCHTPVPWQISV
jgi:hypothetical protein